MTWYVLCIFYHNKRDQEYVINFQGKKKHRNQPWNDPNIEICQHFEAVFVIMVGDINENILTVNKKIRNPGREIETIKKDQMEVLELKNTVPEKLPSCLSLILYIL